MDLNSLLNLLKTCLVIFGCMMTWYVSTSITLLCLDDTVLEVNKLIARVRQCRCGHPSRGSISQRSNRIISFDESLVSGFFTFGPTIIWPVLVSASPWTKMSLWHCFTLGLFGIEALQLACAFIGWVLLRHIKKSTNSHHWPWKLKHSDPITCEQEAR